MPDLDVPSKSGGCLRYVDDAGKAPTRRSSAASAAAAEIAAGRLSTNELPINVWVVLFYSFSTGPYAGLGHVQLAIRYAGGLMEIHDSEVHSGQRAIYTSIDEVLAWLEDYGPAYLGWSSQCDGAMYVV